MNLELVPKGPNSLDKDAQWKAAQQKAGMNVEMPAQSEDFTDSTRDLEEGVEVTEVGEADQVSRAQLDQAEKIYKQQTERQEQKCAQLIMDIIGLPSAIEEATDPVKRSELVKELGDKKAELQKTQELMKKMKASLEDARFMQGPQALQ